MEAKSPRCSKNTQVSPYILEERPTGKIRGCGLCKIIDSENFIKVSQNPNKVARDTQGLPTVPHNDFGGLNFKGLVSKYLLLMTLPPADDEKMKKNRTSGTPTSEKTSDSAFSSKVRSTKVKLEIRNSKNWLG